MLHAVQKILISRSRFCISELQEICAGPQGFVSRLVPHTEHASEIPLDFLQLDRLWNGSVWHITVHWSGRWRHFH